MDSESSMLALLEQILLDESAEPTDLPISLLKRITKDFSHDLQIGSGGFAVVYKGYLGNGGAIAVKKLSNAIDMDETKYNREVGCLMRARHKNIIRFLGYCADTQGKMIDYDGKFVMADVRERLLCFEYLRKGTLVNYIKDASCGLEWRKRYQIIKGICEGLHYLHQKNIVHLDLKPSNILLSGNMEPKISDFGLSRWFNENQSRAIVSSKLFASIGYVAPEYYGGHISFKSDIYSLGVIFTEILTGQKGYSSVDKVLESWRKRLDISSADTVLLEQIKVCAEISICCMDIDPDKRPVIQHIIHKLDETESIELQCTNKLTLEPKLVGHYEDITHPLTESTDDFIKYSISNSMVPQKDRRRKVFTNISNNQWGTLGFEHPMTFDKLALDPAMKQAIMDDLDRFRGRKDYYARVGKPWRRAYLVYGASGTGKSSLIGAMANFLDFDIYALELTSTHSDTDLRKLFIETTSKSIMVIEDVDGILDFTGGTGNKVYEKQTGEHRHNDMYTSSKVTLSGMNLLVNGLWSACGTERLIVFTTAHLEKMDPALLRPGRMDRQIHLGYCSFEQFKILAYIYLGIQSHDLFSVVMDLLEKVEMTPANVAENLAQYDNEEACLEHLVYTLQRMAERKSLRKVYEVAY